MRDAFASWLFGLCCAAVLLPATPALADTIKIVVPFAAGGPVDQLARILANGLGPKLNANVIVDDHRRRRRRDRLRICRARHARRQHGPAGKPRIVRAQPDPQAADGV